MKYHIFLFFLFPILGTAQLLNVVEDRYACNFDNREEERYEEIVAAYHVGKTTLIQVGVLTDVIESEGIITIQLPDGRPIQASSLLFDYIDNYNYTYGGKPPIPQVFLSPPPTQA